LQEEDLQVRDYRGLEEMTGAVSTGLLAGDVVLAIDAALRADQVDEETADALRAGGQYLRALANPSELDTSGSQTGSLAATDAALDAVAQVQREKPNENIQTFLEKLAQALDDAAGGEKLDKTTVEMVVDIFSLLGDLELARVTSLSRERQDPIRWLVNPTPSNLS
jgi:hypothetical protein